MVFKARVRQMCKEMDRKKDEDRWRINLDYSSKSKIYILKGRENEKKKVRRKKVRNRRWKNK